MSHAASPGRGSGTGTSGSQSHSNRAQKGAKGSTATTTAIGGTGHRTRAGTGTANPATAAGLNTVRPTSSSLSPYAYTYGTGTGARPYRAYGYGRGYGNRYYGRGYGYGRSQGYNRAIVSRLRSVHASLARLDHDYQGHRVRAMHSISMAIRQLTHRSMVYQGTGFTPNVNHGLAMAARRGGGGAGARGAGARGGQPMTQAQSDARMSQALRTLQGINMQMSSQGHNTTGHARASGHIQRAIHELNTALAIR
jgi:hypothetical protein